jgi:hypothetical protein
MKLILLLPLTLLFGCGVFDPSIRDTIETVKSNDGCTIVGTEVKVKIKNVGGIESIYINCDWTVPEEEF